MMANKDLESTVIEQVKSGRCSVERALLVVSGLENEEQIRAYQRKLDWIQQDFGQSVNVRRSGSYDKAEALFEYFWEKKPDRYNGDFLLANVIDNQLDKDKNKRVGNCVGLTSLYSVLGVRLGLDLAALYSEDHVLSLLSCRGQEIAIENTLRDGFDCNLYKRAKFQKRDLLVLISTALNNRGAAKERLGSYDVAIRDYNKALELEPDYAPAFNNRGNVKQRLGDYDGAILDYDRAIELEPGYARVFNNRGVAKFSLGDYAGAMQDYNTALELEPDFADALHNRRIATKNLEKKTKP